MSGIAGIIDFEHNLLNHTDIFSNMISALAMRGPDSQGTHISNHAALGSRQLFLTGASGDTQPMTRRFGDYTYTIVCDGELQNAKDLRRELISKNHIFYTLTDTEVFLMSYLEWGASCADKFKGAFSIAIWEHHSQKLFLARDPLGVRPLYYCDTGNTLVFASEIKALFKHPDVSPIIDSTGILKLFSLAPAMPPGETLYSDIYELKAGEFMIHSRLGTYIHTYASLSPKRHTDSFEDTVSHIYETIHNSLKYSIRTKDNCCFLLSGGLDSSALCSMAADEFAKSGNVLRTFSIEYEDNRKYFAKNYFQSSMDDEYINIMQHYLKSEHKTITITNDELANSLRAAVCARDMPGMADVDSSLLIACERLKEHADIVITGECADELFCGYPWFHREDLMYKNVFPWSGSLDLRKSIASPEFAHLPIEEFARQNYIDAMKNVPVLDSESEIDIIRRQMYYVNLMWVGANLINRTDRMSMAYGLQAKMPFASFDLAQYVWNIPWDMKNTGGIEKGLLREAMKNILPKEIAFRKKTPYPKTYNPKYTAILLDILSRILHNKQAPLHNIVNTKVVEEYISNGLEMSTPWYGQLMTGPQFFAFLIQINYWLEDYGVILNI